MAAYTENTAVQMSFREALILVQFIATLLISGDALLTRRTRKDGTTALYTYRVHDQHGKHVAHQTVIWNSVLSDRKAVP